MYSLYKIVCPFEIMGRLCRGLDIHLLGKDATTETSRSSTFVSNGESSDASSVASFDSCVNSFFLQHEPSALAAQKKGSSGQEYGSWCQRPFTPRQGRPPNYVLLMEQSGRWVRRHRGDPNKYRLFVGMSRMQHDQEGEISSRFSCFLDPLRESNAEWMRQKILMPPRITTEDTGTPDGRLTRLGSADVSQPRSAPPGVSTTTDGGMRPREDGYLSERQFSQPKNKGAIAPNAPPVEDKVDGVMTAPPTLASQASQILMPPDRWNAGTMYQVYLQVWPIHSGLLTESDTQNVALVTMLRESKISDFRLLAEKKAHLFLVRNWHIFNE